MSHPIGGRPSAHFPSALHDSQQKLGQDASAQAVEKANQQALDAALKASLAHDDGLTAKQKFARETGDPTLIEEANDEALALGIQRSLDPGNDVPKSVRKGIPEDEFASQRGVIAKLKGWLKNHGFSIKPNNGDRNNCLIISMLQHVTGDYASKHAKEARHYKQQIVQWSGGKEKSSAALHSDDALTRRLIAQINKDYFGDRKEDYVRFNFTTADLHGNPAFREMGDGPRIAGILDGGGHYEAYVKNAKKTGG